MSKINGQQWKEMLVSGVNQLNNNAERINALNVFPVPDGDTGSNMFATADMAKKEIQGMDTTNIGEVGKKFARGMLLGARGNSGVILSQIFKGMSISFDTIEEVGAFELVDAFSKATDQAYKSVMNPVEGTILTVIRITSEKLNKLITKATLVEEFFEIVIKEAKVALDSTPDLLPVLKEVGVVDSGGEGLLMIFEGMLSQLKGEMVIASEANISEVDMFAQFAEEDFDGEFGYCTEFLVELKDPSKFDKEKFEKGIIGMGGTSVVVVRDEEILKTHTHIEKPGDVLNYAQKLGEFLNIKSENMTLQANQSQKTAKANSKTQEIEIPNKAIAIISANVGQGIIGDMKTLGVDFVIEGGQSMNPSAQDFLKAISKIKQEEIIILPNNSNIILVAQQVAQTVSDKKVVIVPSKTQMQGLTAMMYFDPEANISDNEEAMLEAIKEVDTVQVTTSVRDTTIEGVKVKAGEFLSIANGQILKSTKSKIESAKVAIEKLITDDTEIITIYFGEDATRTDGEDLKTIIENKHDIEVEVKDGQQPIYHFLVSVE